MNYNIRLTVISNCPIGCPYNLFLRFPPLRFGAGFSSLAFSVAPLNATDSNFQIIAAVTTTNTLLKTSVSLRTSIRR